MKIVLQKFLNSNIDGKITVNDLMKKFGNDETQVKFFFFNYKRLN